MDNINLFDLEKYVQTNEKIVALAPMDGVSDAPFRYITKKYGNPDIVFTEFTHVHGLCVAGDKLLHHFLYDEIERPVVAQIYGREPEYFYHATKIVCALGFDGVDINMGCPAKNVASSGSGAALIRNQTLAKEIVISVYEGMLDWINNGEITGLSKKTYIHFLEQLKNQKINSKNNKLKTVGYYNLINQECSRLKIPISVKTRIGYDEIITEQWISFLNQIKLLSWISLHGRTLKQMYTGKANWDEIAKAVKISIIPIFGNGDVKTPQDAMNLLKITNAKGILIGRASFGNPFIFIEVKNLLANKNCSTEKIIYDKDIKLKLLIEHTKKFVEIYPDSKIFFQMRKHYGWYSSEFDGATKLRQDLMKISSLQDLEMLLNAANKL